MSKKRNKVSTTICSGEVFSPQNGEHIHLVYIVYREAYLRFPSWYGQKTLLGGGENQYVRCLQNN